MNVLEIQFGESILKFPTVKDASTGEEYIPHTSVLGCFPDARCFLLDGVVVPFLVDPSGALYEPKRIPFMQGKRLQVATIAPISNTQPPPYSTGSPISTLTAVTSLVPSHPQQQIFRVIQDVVSKDSPDYDRLQQQIQQISQQVSEIRDFSLLSLENQSKMLNQLALLQRKVEAILTQNYELHEYPIPRLFIILPMDSTRWDPRNKFRARFKLHFLCECGAHTKQLSHTHDRLPHHIHLALHEGYEVTKPGPFIENYGEYILGMLRMLKYGITLTGMVVPALSSLQVIKGLEGMEDNILKISEQTVLGIDQSISYLESRFQPQLPVGEDTADEDKGDGEAKNGSAQQRATIDESDRYTELRALEGADLRRLQSFLKINDTTKVLGNLYRITTSQGHVKWVCLSHYRSMYREYAMKSLLDHIEASNGSGVYNEHLQRVTMTLNSSTTAAQFFELVSKAPAVSELDVRLQWSFSGSDLARLRDALRVSMVHNLTVDGCHSMRRSDVLSTKRRNDRLLEIMAIDKIQSFCLRGITDFLTKLSSSAFKAMPTMHWLRVLHLSDIECTADDDYWRLSNLLLQCPNLVEVELELADKTQGQGSDYHDFLSSSSGNSHTGRGDSSSSTKIHATEAAAKGSLVMDRLAMLEQLESLTLCNMPLPLSQTQRMPTHLRVLDVAMPTDQLRQDALIQLLAANPGLTEFRLKSTSSRMFITDALLHAIASCSRLEQLECRISLWALNARCKEPWRRLAALPSLKHVRFETTGSVDGVIQLAALVPTVDYFYLETLDGTCDNLVVKVVIQSDGHDDDGNGENLDMANECNYQAVETSFLSSLPSPPLLSPAAKQKRMLTIGDYRAVTDLARVEELMPMLTATAWHTLCIHGKFSHEYDSTIDFSNMDFSQLQHLELKSLPMWTQDRFWKAYLDQTREVIGEQVQQQSSPTGQSLLQHVQCDSLPPTLVEGIQALQGLKELRLVLSDEVDGHGGEDLSDCKHKDDKKEYNASIELAKLLETMDLTSLRRLAISSTAKQQLLTSECVQAFQDRLDDCPAPELEVTLRERNLTLEEEDRLRSLEPQSKVNSIKVNGWAQRPPEGNVPLATE